MEHTDHNHTCGNCGTKFCPRYPEENIFLCMGCSIITTIMQLKGKLTREFIESVMNKYKGK